MLTGSSFRHRFLRENPSAATRRPLRLVAAAIGTLTVLAASPMQAAAQASNAEARLRWPVDISELNVILTNDYNHCKYVSPTKCHTGIDIPAKSASTVKPAANGNIALIQLNGGGVGCTANGGCEDKGLGNSIIVWHGLLDVYTQYSHLDDISDDIEKGMDNKCSLVQGYTKRYSCHDFETKMNTEIGSVGGSGNGQQDKWPIHLHFEVKIFGTLGLGKLGDWGYSLKPEQNGWLDPVEYLHATTVLPSGTAVRVTATGNEINLRTGPGGVGTTKYPTMRELKTNERFVAVRSAAGTTSPQCSGGWYQVKPLDVNERLESTKFPPVDGRRGEIPDGWVCVSDDGQGIFLQTILQPSSDDRAVLKTLYHASRLRNSWGWRLGAVLNSPGKHPFALDRRLDAGSGGPAARREVEVGLFRRVADRASEHRWVTDAGRAPRGVAGGALVMSPGVRAGRR